MPASAGKLALPDRVPKHDRRFGHAIETPLKLPWAQPDVRVALSPKASVTSTFFRLGLMLVPLTFTQLLNESGAIENRFAQRVIEEIVELERDPRGRRRFVREVAKAQTEPNRAVGVDERRRRGHEDRAARAEILPWNIVDELGRRRTWREQQRAA